MKTRFKKSASIAVALVMIISLCFSAPFTVSAAAESTDTYTSFEIGEYNKNVTYLPGDFASGTGVISLSTAEAHSGSTSLKYDTTNEQCLRFAYAYNGTQSALKLESNTTYTITFWYKATAKSDWLNIHLGLWDDVRSDNAWNDATRVDIRKQSVEVMNEWTEVSFKYTTGDCGERPYLIIGFSGGGTASKVVYIDDINIVKSVSVVNTDTETSFEIDGYNKDVQNQPGDFASGTGVISLSTAEAHSGSTSLKYDTANEQCLRFAYAYNGTKSALKLESNTTYTITFWYKATAKSDWLNIHLALWDDVKADNAYSDDTRVDIRKQSVEVMNEWTKVSFDYTTGDCSKRAYLIIGFNGGGSASKVVYIDDVSVVKCVNTDTHTSFEGVEVNSTDANAGFYSSGLASVSNDEAHSGNSSLKLDSQGNNGLVRFAYAYNAAKNAIKLESNSTYVVTYWYKATALPGWANIRLRLGDASSVYNSDNDSDISKFTELVQGEWTEVSVTVNTDDCSEKPYLLVGFQAELPNTVIYIDDITVVKSVNTNTYTSFEGVEVNSTDANAGFYSTGLASVSNEEAHSGNSSLKLDSNGNSNMVRYAYAYTDAKKAIKLESNSAYVITYWYKATALPGWANIRLSLGDASNSNHSNDDKEISKFTELVQGEWTEVSVTVNTGDCSEKPYLLVGFQTELPETVIYIDDITVTKLIKATDDYTSFEGVEVNSTDTNAGFYSSGLASVSNEEAHSGNSSLKLDSKGNSNMVRFAYAYTESNNAIKLESNSTYVVTYWYKATALPGWANIRLRLGDAANVNNSNHDADISKFTELVDGIWTKVSVTVNTGDCSEKPYLLVGFHTEFAETVIYIDDITVTLAEQVTLNNRGVISTIVSDIGAELAPIDSNLDEQVFLGWYSDPECTIPYGTVQANESRIAYAKYDTIKITFGNENKQLNAGDTFTVPCYDGADIALNLKANTTYAMRFVYKPMKDSAAGKFAVLGNEFKFNAYDADNSTAWIPASITFTTTDATALQLAVVSDGSASALVDDILVYELDYTPGATVSAGNSTISVTKPVAQNNMQTGTVTVYLAEGEQLKANGLNITYDLYATAFSDPIASKIFVPANEDGTSFTYTVPANAKNIAVSAEFSDAGELNMEIIAASIRKQSNRYTSGLRFRGRVYNNGNIKEVGFLLAPEALVTEAGFNALTLDNATACNAWTVMATGITYDETALYSDYQVLLTNIDELLDTKIQCVMFVEYNDGTVKYSAAKAQSYNTVNDTMNKVYRGITSYYTDEYEDTRNKLLQTQNNGAFSFLALTDIHIDYVHTVGKDEHWYTTPAGSKLPDRYNIQREIAMVIEMANTTDVDCIILGGDLIHGTESHSSALADLNYLAQVFQKAKVPVITARGNHDHNDYPVDSLPPLEKIITNEEWSTTLIDPLAKNAVAVHNDSIDPYSPYYYVDFPEKKTRVVVLDAWNYPIKSEDGIYSKYNVEKWGTYGDDDQVTWLAKVALDADKQGWNYVLSTHAPITGTDSRDNTNENTIRNIIEAFNNKTTVEVFGTTYDYSTYDGQMPLNVSGHTHVQSWRLLGDTLAAINTASGRLAYYPNWKYVDTETQKDYQPVRYEGTYSEACFDAVVYDPTIDTIQRFNFGNRPDDMFVITENGIEVTVTPHEGPLK